MSMEQRIFIEYKYKLKSKTIIYLKDNNNIGSDISIKSLKRKT
jgi:hypothetical protein